MFNKLIKEFKKDYQVLAHRKELAKREDEAYRLACQLSDRTAVKFFDKYESAIVDEIGKEAFNKVFDNMKKDNLWFVSKIHLKHLGKIDLDTNEGTFLAVDALRANPVLKSYMDLQTGLEDKLHNIVRELAMEDGVLF